MRVKEYLCTQIFMRIIMTTTDTLLLVMAVVVLACI